MKYNIYYVLYLSQYRNIVDLRCYADIIIETVQEELPGYKVVVNEHDYCIVGYPSQKLPPATAKHIGRMLAKNSVFWPFADNETPGSNKFFKYSA